MRISDCAAWLRQRSGFLILSHHRPDGDALGSAAALCRGLRILGKTAYILDGGLSAQLVFLYHKTNNIPGKHADNPRPVTDIIYSG